MHEWAACTMTPTALVPSCSASRSAMGQERMTKTIADLLEERLGTSAVGVIVQAEHSCMSMRGVRKQGSMTVTSAMRG
ncbi:MAG: GTP cyclohydrolase I, partial [Planctomycetaceae bacterium]